MHLGADRLLILGVRARRAAGVAVTQLPIQPPSPGQIFGYMLDTLFTDQIYGDLEQLERINELVHAAPEQARGARAVETLMLAPSVDPREIAARHIDEMPRSLRALLRVIGARDAEGSQLASYLMFEGRLHARADRARLQGRDGSPRARCTRSSPASTCRRSSPRPASRRPPSPTPAAGTPYVRNSAPRPSSVAKPMQSVNVVRITPADSAGSIFMPPQQSAARARPPTPRPAD